MYVSREICLSNTRFSGTLSNDFHNYKTAGVLSANIWECEVNQLPTSDMESRYYDCNTALYTNSIIAWGGFFALAVVLGLIYFWYKMLHVLHTFLEIYIFNWSPYFLYSN